MRGMRLIAGSGRSGTTWILDSLAAANGLRPVFEPLHPNVSAIGNRYAHGALRASDRCPDLEKFLADVCAGQSIPLWTKYRRQRHWLMPPAAEFSTRQDAGRTARRWGKFFRDLPGLIAASSHEQPLVPCIRANLKVDWVVRGHGWKVVLIVRHPAAVIESEIRGAWNAEFALERFRRNAILHDLTEGRYAGLLARRLSPVESLAARWVVENQWVVEQAEEIGFTVLHYENLRVSPETEWPKILGALGLERVPDPALLALPSQQSSPRDGDAKPLSRRTGWQRALGAEQLAGIQGILDSVECDMYSVGDPEPRRNVSSAAQVAGTKAAT
jgi:hypothetical protein